MPTLIALCGLPGTGKSSIARELARQTGAMWVRIDSLEQAIRASGLVSGELNDAGYRAGYAVAQDNLRLGRDVIADSVNPWRLTRDAWRAAGAGAGATVLEVEIVCSDEDEHRRRVETRAVDVPGLVLPEWRAVVERDYQPWDRERLVVDTAGHDLAASVAIIRLAMKPGVDPAERR